MASETCLAARGRRWDRDLEGHESDGTRKVLALRRSTSGTFAGALRSSSLSFISGLAVTCDGSRDQATASKLRRERCRALLADTKGAGVPRPRFTRVYARGMPILENDGEVAAFTLEDLDELGEYFVVPDYQRGYVWELERAREFVGTLLRHFQPVVIGAIHENKALPYWLGLVTLQRTAQDAEGAAVEVSDGQQRLMTLHLIGFANYLFLLKQTWSDKTTRKKLARFLGATRNCQARLRWEAVAHQSEGKILQKLCDALFAGEEPNLRTALVPGITFEQLWAAAESSSGMRDFRATSAQLSSILDNLLEILGVLRQWPWPSQGRESSIDRFVGCFLSRVAVPTLTVNEKRRALNVFKMRNTFQAKPFTGLEFLRMYTEDSLRAKNRENKDLPILRNLRSHFAKIAEKLAHLSPASREEAFETAVGTVYRSCFKQDDAKGYLSDQRAFYMHFVDAAIADRDKGKVQSVFLELITVCECILYLRNGLNAKDRSWFAAAEIADVGQAENSAFVQLRWLLARKMLFQKYYVYFEDFLVAAWVYTRRLCASTPWQGMYWQTIWHIFRMVERFCVVNVTLRTVWREAAFAFAAKEACDELTDEEKPIETPLDLLCLIAQHFAVSSEDRAEFMVRMSVPKFYKYLRDQRALFRYILVACDAAARTREQNTPESIPAMINSDLWFEHIHPQASKDTKEKWWLHSLGNIVLVNRVLNQALSAGKYSEKLARCEDYRDALESQAGMWRAHIDAYPHAPKKQKRVWGLHSAKGLFKKHLEDLIEAFSLYRLYPYELAERTRGISPFKDVWSVSAAECPDLTRLFKPDGGLSLREFKKRAEKVLFLEDLFASMPETFNISAFSSKSSSAWPRDKFKSICEAVKLGPSRDNRERCADYSDRLHDLQRQHSCQNPRTALLLKWLASGRCGNEVAARAALDFLNSLEQKSGGLVNDDAAAEKEIDDEAAAEEENDDEAEEENEEEAEEENDDDAEKENDDEAEEENDDEAEDWSDEEDEEENDDDAEEENDDEAEEENDDDAEEENDDDAEDWSDDAEEENDEEAEEESDDEAEEESDDEAEEWSDDEAEGESDDEAEEDSNHERRHGEKTKGKDKEVAVSLHQNDSSREDNGDHIKQESDQAKCREKNAKSSDDQTSVSLHRDDLSDKKSDMHGARDLIQMNHSKDERVGANEVVAAIGSKISPRKQAQIKSHDEKDSSVASQLSVSLVDSCIALARSQSSTSKVFVSTSQLDSDFEALSIVDRCIAKARKSS